MRKMQIVIVFYTAIASLRSALELCVEFCTRPVAIKINEVIWLFGELCVEFCTRPVMFPYHMPIVLPKPLNPFEFFPTHVYRFSKACKSIHTYYPCKTVQIHANPLIRFEPMLCYANSNAGWSSYRLVLIGWFLSACSFLSAFPLGRPPGARRAHTSLTGTGILVVFGALVASIIAAVHS